MSFYHDDDIMMFWQFSDEQLHLEFNMCYDPGWQAQLRQQNKLIHMSQQSKQLLHSK